MGFFLFVCLCLSFVSCSPSGFPGGSAGKKSARNAGELGSIPGLGRSPGKGKGYPLHNRPGEFHGLYSPWGRKESTRLSDFHSLCSLRLYLRVSTFHPPLPVYPEPPYPCCASRGSWCLAAAGVTGISVWDTGMVGIESGSTAFEKGRMGGSQLVGAYTLSCICLGLPWWFKICLQYKICL